MYGGDEEEKYELLAEHQLYRSGLTIKLDRGFEPGIYCCYVEFDELAAKKGFTKARRAAIDYCALLKNELKGLGGYPVGPTKDASASGDPRRRHDLESTFLSFAIETGDGRYHDRAVKQQFWLAFLRAGQSWDQANARTHTERLGAREREFRRRLGELLEDDAYASLDACMRQRLLEEVPRLAFDRKERGI